jgi:putative ABC transport system ATP-binding protein
VNPSVEVENVSKIYPQGETEVRALNGLSLAIQPGEFTAICGPSGSGKTTLLNLMGALDKPTSGEVRVDGQRLAELGRRELSHLRRDRIGFVFQAYNLIPVLTAYENAEMVLRLQGVEEGERRDRVMSVLSDVGLSGLEDRRPDQLSGGQQQRVAIARAIASNPAVVLADEPTANVDSDTADRLLEIMEKLNRERSETFVFSTHDPRVLERARRVVRIVDGQIEDDQTET